MQVAELEGFEVNGTKLARHYLIMWQWLSLPIYLYYGNQGMQVGLLKWQHRRLWQKRCTSAWTPGARWGGLQWINTWKLSLIQDVTMMLFMCSRFKFPLVCKLYKCPQQFLELGGERRRNVASITGLYFFWNDGGLLVTRLPLACVSADYPHIY
jgi:hypothetical protein